MADLCCVCDNLTSPKLRRLITGSTFPAQILHLIEQEFHAGNKQSKFICNTCFNTLNKVSKLDQDIATKIPILKNERESLMGTLKRKDHKTLEKIVNKVEMDTPSPCPSKAPIFQFHSPVPVKKENHGHELILRLIPATDIQINKSSSDQFHQSIHVKKKENHLLELLSAPSQQINMSSSDQCHQAMHVKKKENHLPELLPRLLPAPSQPISKSSSDLCHQTVQCEILKKCQDFHVKVEVNYPSQLKTRIIHEQGRQELCKAIVRDSAVGIANAVWKDSSVKMELKKLVLKELSAECEGMCSNSVPCLLQRVTPDDLVGLDIQNVMQEWCERSPLFVAMLDACITSNTKQNVYKPALVTAGSILLHGRNPRVAGLHHAIGHTLDHGGATAETLDTMHRLGMSVSLSSIQKKRKDPLKRQEAKINFGIKKVKEQTQCTHEWICDRCGKRFTAKSSLTEHLLRHTGERNHKCNECGKKYKASHDLHRHRLTHGDKKHKCTVCGKKFLLARYLKQHMVIHTGEKKHQCYLCDKRFFTGYSLKAHMRVHMNFIVT